MTFVATTKRRQPPRFSVGYSVDGSPNISVEFDNTNSTVFARVVHIVGTERNVLGWFPPGSSRTIRVGSVVGQGDLVVEGDSPKERFGSIRVPNSIVPFTVPPVVLLSRVPAEVSTPNPIFSTIKASITNPNTFEIRVDWIRLDEEPVVVSSVQVAPGQTAIVFDQSAGTKRVAYRVRTGDTFEDFVVNGVSDNNEPQVVTFLQQHLRTIVQVDSLPANVIAVQAFQAGRLLGEVRPGSGSCRFINKAAQTPGRFYRYTFKAFRADGSSYEFSASHRRYPDATQLDLSFAVKGLELNTFEVVLELGDKGIQRVLRQVSEVAPEYLSSFGGDIQSRRSSIAATLFYEVERVSLDDDTSTSLGVHSANERVFTDTTQDPSVSYRYVFTPIVQGPVATIEAQQTQRDLDGVGTRTDRVRRFFNPLVRSHQALPSRSRVVADEQEIPEYLLATASETELAKVAAEVEVYRPATTTRPQPELSSSSFAVVEQRIGANTPDVVVRALFTSQPENGVIVRLRGSNGSTSTYRYLVASREFERRIPAPPITPVEVEIEVA